MVRKDEAREWQNYQRVAEELKREKLETQLASYDTAAFSARVDAADAAIDKAEETLQSQADESARLQAEINQLMGRLTSVATTAKFQNAVRDVRRADLDILIRDAADAGTIAAAQSRFDAAQVKAEELGVVVQEVTAELNAAKQELAALTAARDAARIAKQQLEADRDRLREQLELLAPSNPAVAIKRKMKEWPILNGFNPHLKVLYDWPSRQGSHLEQQLGMARVERVDRCRTCHVNINDFAAGGLAGYPAGDPATGGYEQPFASHPHPELYLNSSSPHPIEMFGCTICHLGDGSGTSFQNAEHTPSDPAMAKQWHEEFGWFSNHFWEQPMLPSMFTEASCLKCHHNVVELGQNVNFGSSAPKLVEGYELIKEYGCYGCHPINGYDGTKPIGPDLRLEPQSEAEALAIAADPNQLPGRERKVGPSLAHVGQKVADNFISYWTEEPQRFRPDTRMPQFFHLTNQEDRLAELLQPVELAGIEAYLRAKSQPLALLQPKEGYVPDAERGKQLFAQRGCLACHSHDDEEFAGISQTFGPNISKIHEKVRPGAEGFNWMYTWLKEPTLHHPRTRMPNLFLIPTRRVAFTSIQQPTSQRSC
ncbi:MAG: c-type cytochrome [Planctomycetaceae bacterium]